jgi:hypothetical protein
MVDHIDAEYQITSKWELRPLTAGLPNLKLPNPLRRGWHTGARVLVTTKNGTPCELKPAPKRVPVTEPVTARVESGTVPKRSQRAAAPARSAAQRPAPTGYFANPYNFVPFSTAMRRRSGLEQADPVPQDRARPDRYSAKLQVSFTTATPLLTLEVASKQRNQPTVYTVRRDADGKPVIQGTSIKGVVRSLFEQVTGSRLGVFSHSDGLTVRTREGKRTFVNSPADLLRDELRPASTAKEFTAAERVFGWVSDRDGAADKAVRGRLRVGGVVCVEEPGARHPDGVWRLATLNSPKPSHARFYTRDRNGDPLHSMPKADGFTVAKGHQLAGHKVYPHQIQDDAYWSLPGSGWAADGQPPPQVAGKYLNFLAANGTPAEVSMAIRDWVEPGSKFTTSIYVEDVAREELVALLWVLTASAQAEGEGPQWYLKLGQGRPLGLGSIMMSVDWESSVIRSHADTLSRYGCGEPGAGEDWPKVVEAFEQEFQSVAPETFLSIQAAAQGTALPVYYPRIGTTAQSELEPQAETYKWFVENEKRERHGLPLLSDDDEVLPTNPAAGRGQQPGSPRS